VALNSGYELHMAVARKRSERPSYESQATAGVANCIPLPVDITYTGGRNSDIPYEATL
jgi:hypothetical protein